MRNKQFLVLIVLLALALPASPAHAGGIVTTCDEASLLTALADGGTVTFACSGTITLSSRIIIAADTTIDGSGQTVTISGNNAVRMFTVNSAVTLQVNKLTFANGYAAGAGSILNNGTLVVSNSIFSGNSAPTNYGGAIYNNFDSTLIVSNSTFDDNNTNGLGGGIVNLGTATVSSSIFSGNSAGAGGGIANRYGTMTVSNTIFDGNSAQQGGGIENQGLLTVTNSTFSGNSATYGGGIENTGSGQLIVGNSTLHGNLVSNQGGGIDNSGGYVGVSNSTFHGNSATLGGGGFFSTSYPTVLQNTIVANSLAGGNCAGPWSNYGGNLSYPDTTCPGINADPALGPLQDNGGPTLTMALLPGSAAIDAGSDANCAADPVNSRDQRGIARPLGLHCDIGAVEEYCPNFSPPASVGVEDIVAIAGRWGWTDSTPGWDPAYDFNRDSLIDMPDIMLVTAAWGRTCS